MSATEQFWDKVYRGEGACWLWFGATNGIGYGHLRVGSRLDGTKRKVYAHRFSWEMEHGPIPAGMHVLHRCDRPECVNPAHLFLGTAADNMADMHAKGRARELRGEQMPAAKLTEDAVREIRRRPRKHGAVVGMAREFGVARNTIHHVLNGTAWSHVT